MNPAPNPLERFVRAQRRNYAQALAELSAGRKQSHWIWYVLPQLRELGRSQMAREYGIANLAEAASYLCHPLLGPRLVECVHAILRHSDRSAADILGNVDAMKFRSCLSLFAALTPTKSVFAQALAVFYQGKPDEETLRLLGMTAT